MKRDAVENMRNVYEDHAGVLLWRGPEVAACPDQSDLHRQELCFSRKSTELVYRRGSVAWRLAGSHRLRRPGFCFSRETTKQSIGDCPGSVAVKVAARASRQVQPLAGGRWRRMPYPVGSRRPGARYRAPLRPSFARPPVMRRASRRALPRRASPLPAGDRRVFVFANEDRLGGNQ